MGLDNVASSPDTNVASSDFLTSTQTNDRSNPQQGTGGTKVSMEENQEDDKKNRKDRNSVTTKSGAVPLYHNSGDTRKLFVGGLPTDSKFFFKFLFVCFIRDQYLFEYIV